MRSKFLLLDFHVLNGDALTDRFDALGLEGKIIVTREALISGSLEGDTLVDFYRARANYLVGPGPSDLQQYYAYSVAEFDKISTAGKSDRFFLWFGYDLFCLINMLFIISRIRSLSDAHEIRIVYPAFRTKELIWNDFAGADAADLQFSLDQSILMSEEDKMLADKLWLAFREKDAEAIEELSLRQSPAFPYLRPVCDAHLARFPKDGSMGKPEEVLTEIIRKGKKDFASVFADFQKAQAIYGFGDTQVKEIFDEVISSGKF